MREVRQASTVIRPTPCWSLLAVTVPASVPPTPAGSTPSRGTAPAGAADVEPAAPAAVPFAAPRPRGPARRSLTAVAAKNDGGATLVYGSAPSTDPTPSRKISAHAARIAASTSDGEHAGAEPRALPQHERHGLVLVERRRLDLQRALPVPADQLTWTLDAHRDRCAVTRREAQGGRCQRGLQAAVAVARTQRHVERDVPAVAYLDLERGSAPRPDHARCGGDRQARDATRPRRRRRGGPRRPRPLGRSAGR